MELKYCRQCGDLHIPFHWHFFKYFLFSNPWGHIRNTFYSILNILAWVPVLWEDVDWDYSALYRIMEFKLRRMAKDTDTWHVAGAERDKERLLEAAILCNRIANEPYLFVQGIDEFKVVPQADYDVHFTDKQRKADLKRLCEMLEKYSLGWWD